MKFIVFLLNIAAGILGAFVMTKLWGWFVVPFGIMQVTLWHMFGLSLFYNMLGIASKNIKETAVFTEVFKKSCKEISEESVPFLLVVVWLVTWLTGYLIHLAM